MTNVWIWSGNLRCWQQPLPKYVINATAVLFICLFECSFPHFESFLLSMLMLLLQLLLVVLLLLLLTLWLLKKWPFFNPCLDLQSYKLYCALLFLSPSLSLSLPLSLSLSEFLPLWLSSFLLSPSFSLSFYIKTTSINPTFFLVGWLPSFLSYLYNAGVQVFDPINFSTWVSCNNHKTRAPAQDNLRYSVIFQYIFKLIQCLWICLFLILSLSLSLSFSLSFFLFRQFYLGL